MNIKFWGVRGSIPTPSTPNFSTSRYGGNTTCVSVHAPGVILIFDGGSGLRSLGMYLQPLMPVHATFFFSHLHWDHIQGFPFFTPAYVPGNSFDMHGPKLCVSGNSGASLLGDALRHQQSHYNFPVELSNMPARMKISDMDPGQCVELSGSESVIKVTCGALNHPGGCFGYRIEEHRGNEIKSFVFTTDSEHTDEPCPSIQKLAHRADILMYDAQYTPEQYEGKVGQCRKGWGHSTYLHGIREARNAGVRRLLLTHHDPLNDDWALARIENEARREGLLESIEVQAAYEGMWITL